MKTNTNFKKSKDEIFAFVKKDNKIHVCLGGYLASQKTFDTFQQAQEYVNSKPWELLINICSIIICKSNESVKKEEAEVTESNKAN